MWIVLEGIDGSGKTSLQQLLAKKIPSALLLREPSQGHWGLRIRKILQNQEKYPGQEAMLQLFRDDRLWHLQEKILKGLKDGHTLIQDRYFFSTAAYQAATTSNSVGILQSYLQDARFLLPDCVFFIDVPVRVSLARIHARAEENDSKEIFENYEKLKQTRKNYKAVFASFQKSHPHKYCHLDGELSLQQLQKQIQEQLQALAKELFNRKVTDVKNE